MLPPSEDGPTDDAVVFASGETKTLGIMLPGEYEFGTAKKEIMDIMAGNLEVKLPGRDEWLAIQGGQTFEVPANASFSLIVKNVVDYCCSYLEE